MARPKKQRRCEGRMCGKAFKPTCVPLDELKRIPLHRDELEALRLCDLEGLTQEQAGRRMGVSRGTVQRILAAARGKVARALTEGAALIIEEGGQEEPLAAGPARTKTPPPERPAD